MKFLFFLGFCLFVSCAAKSPTEADLLRYAQAKKAYAAGAFEEAALTLAPLAFPEALFLRAKALYFLGNLSEAEKFLRRVRKLRPSSLESGLFLARLYYEQGGEEQAMEMAESLLADDSENIRALRLASELAFAGGRDGEALAFLERAVAAGGELALVFLDRARFRWTGGDEQGALLDLSAAAALVRDESFLGRSILNLKNTIEGAMR
jgi:tetratricopeptide (TPR) repeat protein